MSDVIKGVPNEVIGLAGLLAAGAIGWYFTRPTREPHTSQDLAADAATGSTVGGITITKGARTAHSGLKLTPRIIKWVIKLRAECSYDIVPELILTSTVRDEWSQARAMLAYLADYGATSSTRTTKGTAAKTDLTTLYKGAATELLALPQRDAESWAPKVRSLYDRGLLKKGGHYDRTGGAIDVRGDVGTAEGREIIRAALKAGAKAAYDDGPAIHVDLPAEAA